MNSLQTFSFYSRLLQKELLLLDENVAHSLFAEIEFLQTKSKQTNKQIKLLTLEQKSNDQ